MSLHIIFYMYIHCEPFVQVLGNVSPNPRESVRKRALDNLTIIRSNDYLPGMYITFEVRLLAYYASSSLT